MELGENKRGLSPASCREKHKEGVLQADAGKGLSIKQL
jgi:hypothetical protein